MTFGHPPEYLFDTIEDEIKFNRERSKPKVEAKKEPRLIITTVYGKKKKKKKKRKKK